MAQPTSRARPMPERPRLAAARAAISGLTDPAAAWRVLAERRLVPGAWLDDPRRRFIHDRGPHPTRDPAFAVRGPHPGTVSQCALFASDVGGVLAAEAAARVLADRCVPWGAPPCEPVVWWAIPRSHHGYATTDTRPGVRYALMAALHFVCRAVPDHDPVDPFENAGYWAALWRGATACRTLPNPFEALAAIERTGYSTLEYVGADGAFFLVAPVD